MTRGDIKVSFVAIIKVKNMKKIASLFVMVSVVFFLGCEKEVIAPDPQPNVRVWLQEPSVLLYGECGALYEVAVSSDTQLLLEVRIQYTGCHWIGPGQSVPDSKEFRDTLQIGIGEVVVGTIGVRGNDTASVHISHYIL